MARSKSSPTDLTEATTPPSQEAAQAAWKELRRVARLPETEPSTEALRETLWRLGAGAQAGRVSLQTADMSIEVLDGPDVRSARLSDGPAVLKGLLRLNVSEDGVDHTPIQPGKLAAGASVRVLCEEARTFESEWVPVRQGRFWRAWRHEGPVDETGLSPLKVELFSPQNAQTALSDAAWDLIQGIKDRTFQRELMRRSDEVGLLSAVLGARHKGAAASLEARWDAHFAVQSICRELPGEWSALQGALREMGHELTALQEEVIQELAATLKSGLSS